MNASRQRDAEMGGPLSYLAAYPPWTPHEELAKGAQLVRARKVGRAKLVARLEAEFVRANLRLVVSMARGYLRRGIELPDLIQEGNLGLMRAAQLFRPELGYRFSTYSSNWIRQAMSRAIQNGGVVRTPVHILDADRQLRRVEERHLSLTGSLPSDHELARMTGKKDRAVRRARATRALAWPIALDAPLEVSADGAPVTRLEMLASETPSPEAVALQTERERAAWRMLGSLSERERRVLLARANGKTLEEAAAPFGFTRERARQIECKALDKIRRGERRRQAREWRA